MPPPLLTSTTTPGIAFVDQLVRFGDRPALITADGIVSYRELSGRVADTAARLGSQRRLVVVVGANRVEAVVGYLAALAGGHPVLLTGPRDDTGSDTGSDTSLDPLIDAYDPDVVIGPVHGWDVLERREGTAHDLHPDLALLLSTSGSTGSPKLVRLSHENVNSNAEAIADYLALRDTDRAATTLPIHYCYGLSVLNSHLLRGAGIILTELSVVDPCFWRLFREHRGTTFAGVPYTFDQLDRIGFDQMSVPDLRYVTQAGGRLAPDRVRRYAELGQRRGWDLFVMYGQTEATARMAYLPPDLASVHPGVIGVPIAGGSFTVQPLPDWPEADVGELVYSGPNVMLGYAETAADLARGRTVRVLYTGDVVRRTRSGMPEVVGRRSRFAKIFGLRIDLQQVESVLDQHGVAGCCADGGDRLVIAIEHPFPAERIQRLARRRFGLPAWTVAVQHVQQIPRLATGKPDYRAIAALRGDEDRTPATAAVPDVRALYAELLDATDVRDDDTFAGLDGDSLSYVEMSIRLEELLGHLPAHWHTTPIRDLVPSTRPRRGWRQIEVSVALRALAIVLIVGSHTNLFTVLGGAHALLAVAGFNFGRFQLTAAPRRTRARHLLTAIARIVVPSVAWIGVVTATTGFYPWTNVALLNAVLGPDHWTEPQWQFWFVEALVYTLLALAALLAIPWLDRAERRWSFWLPMAAVGLGLLFRYELVQTGTGDRIHTALAVWWLFALGWATAKASTRWHRVLVSVAVVATVPGFFDDTAREAVVVAGLLVLIWASSVRLPPGLGRLTGVLAAASLYVYLTHWQIYPHLEDDYPLLGLLASLVVGVAYWQLVTRVPRLVRRRQSASAR
ncbi:MAG TPA: AMP-binding protein [Nocardioidaceae bacterium]|nr:AMP-binding protein [Nocardioidaceae bacterium]